jgi:dTDP-4-amino-4,6-dideoxygalactose transaminase
MKYNPWPIGKLPSDFRRPELDELRKLGFRFDDAREVIDIFENELAKYSGSKYAVVVDCATNALFLSLKYLGISGLVEIPARTYVSVAMTIIHAGCSVATRDYAWSGIYELGDTGVFDGSARFTPNMFVGGENSLHCLSFQIKKRLPIGRGGAILTNDSRAREWLMLARYDGRDLNTPYDSVNHIKGIGWHMYMTPEDAARGLILLNKLGGGNFADVANQDSYPDIRPWLDSLKVT